MARAPVSGECVSSGRQCSNCLPHDRHRCKNSAGDLTERLLSSVRESSSSAAASEAYVEDPASPQSSASTLVAADDSTSFSPPVALCVNGEPVASTSIPSAQSFASGTLVDSSATGVADPAIIDATSASRPVNERAGDGAAWCVRPSSTTSEDQSATTVAGCCADVDPVAQLPAFQPQQAPTFQWGTVDGPEFAHSITCANDEAVHWRRNVFTLPSGSVGKAFVEELSKLFRAYAETSVMECIALKAAALMPLLLLQRPHAKCKAKDLVACLQRRLLAWKAGDIDGLVREARVLQRSLPSQRQHHDADHTARVFSRLMFPGESQGSSPLDMWPIYSGRSAAGSSD